MGALSPTNSAAETPAARLAADRVAVRAELEALCARGLTGLAADVADAIRYSVLGGGKLLRPALVLGAYRAAGGRGEAAALAASVEVVHAYSLVHDDLQRVHRAKTGALIAGAVRIGAMAAGCGARGAGALARYGEALGLAFQI